MMKKSETSSKLETISIVVERNLCMGCGTCAGLCPRNAIAMELHIELGEYRPILNEDLCSYCGICLGCCPGHTVELGRLCHELWGVEPFDRQLGHYLSGQIAYAQDECIRYACSSGGLISTLLMDALQAGLIDGAVVTRMRAEVPWQAEAFIATTADEILSARGSKYCPVPVNLALREIMQRDGRYAFVGLPCHIYALRLAQQRFKPLKERVVLVLGLFCAGGRSFKGLEVFLSQSGLGFNDVASVVYRGDGWPGYTRIKTNLGKTLNCSYEAAYPFMCLNDVNRCAFCPDKSSELADLSFGDLWLPEERATIGSGKSVVIARSPVGQDLLAQAVTRGSIAVSPLDHARLLHTVNPGDKKVGVAARLRLAGILGRSTPQISESGLMPYSGRDLMKAANYLGVQAICRPRFLRWLYLNIRPKYRKLRKQIVEEA